MDLSERRDGEPNRHPWEIARARFFCRLLSDSFTPGAPLRWLDVGAGDGWLASTFTARLPPGSAMTCWDAHYSAHDVEQCARTYPAATFVATRPPGRFDVITMLDVVEHVADDRAFVDEVIGEHLAPGGRLVVSVPAYQRLFSDHDRQLGHHRRYAPDEMRALLADRVSIDREGGLFASLLPARAAGVALERRRARDTAPGDAGVGSWGGGRALTAAIAAVLTADGAVSLAVSRRGRYLPGLSYWAVCTSR